MGDLCGVCVGGGANDFNGCWGLYNIVKVEIEREIHESRGGKL